MSGTPDARKRAADLVWRRGGVTKEYVLAESGAILEEIVLITDDGEDPSGFWPLDVV